MFMSEGDRPNALDGSNSSVSFYRFIFFFYVCLYLEYDCRI